MAGRGITLRYRHGNSWPLSIIHAGLAFMILCFAFCLEYTTGRKSLQVALREMTKMVHFWSFRLLPHHAHQARQLQDGRNGDSNPHRDGEVDAAQEC